MPSRVAHRPPRPILPGFTGRKPSGIPAATALRPCALVSSSFPSRLRLGGYLGPPVRCATREGIPGECHPQRKLSGYWEEERETSKLGGRGQGAARCPSCSQNAHGLVCLVGWSIWFFWMNFQSHQPDKPDRRDRPDEPTFVGRAHDGTDSGHFEGLGPMKGGEKRASLAALYCFHFKPCRLDFP
jgi:hypothetical protein